MISSDRIVGLYATAAENPEYCALVVTKYIKDIKALIADFKKEGPIYRDAYGKVERALDHASVDSANSIIRMRNGSAVFFVSYGTLEKLNHFRFPCDPCRIVIDPDLTVSADHIMSLISTEAVTKEITEWISSIPVNE